MSPVDSLSLNISPGGARAGRRAGAVAQSLSGALWFEFRVNKTHMGWGYLVLLSPFVYGTLKQRTSKEHTESRQRQYGREYALP